MYRTFLILACLCIGPELTSAKAWQVLFSPITWTKNAVVGEPMKMGSQLRSYLSSGSSKSPKVETIVNLDQYRESLPPELQQSSAKRVDLVSGMLEMLRPRIIFEKIGSTTLPPAADNAENQASFIEDEESSDTADSADGEDEDLQQEIKEQTEVSSENLSENSEAATENIQNFTEDTDSDQEAVVSENPDVPQGAGSASQNVEIPEGETGVSLKTKLKENHLNQGAMLAAVSSGMPCFDGRNLALRLPSRTGAKTEGPIKRISFAHFPQLRQFMDGESVIIFTGLGFDDAPIVSKPKKVRTKEYVVGSVKTKGNKVVSASYVEPVKHLEQIQDSELTARNDDVPEEPDYNESTSSENIDDVFETTQSSGFSPQELTPTDENQPKAEDDTDYIDISNTKNIDNQFEAILSPDVSIQKSFETLSTTTTDTNEDTTSVNDNLDVTEQAPVHASIVFPTSFSGSAGKADQNASPEAGYISLDVHIPGLGPLETERLVEAAIQSSITDFVDAELRSKENSEEQEPQSFGEQDSVVEAQSNEPFVLTESPQPELYVETSSPSDVYVEPDVPSASPESVPAFFEENAQVEPGTQNAESSPTLLTGDSQVGLNQERPSSELVPVFFAENTDLKPGTPTGESAPSLLAEDKQAGFFVPNVTPNSVPTFFAEDSPASPSANLDSGVAQTPTDKPEIFEKPSQAFDHIDSSDGRDSVTQNSDTNPSLQIKFGIPNTGSSEQARDIESKSAFSADLIPPPVVETEAPSAKTLPVTFHQPSRVLSEQHFLPGTRTLLEKRQGDVAPLTTVTKTKVLQMSSVQPEMVETASEYVDTVRREMELQGGIDNYLAHLRKNYDKENCLSLLICEVGAKPERYGHQGKKTHMFFKNHTFSRASRQALWFKTVFRIGENIKSVHACKSTFRSCTSTTTQLLDLGRRRLFSTMP